MAGNSQKFARIKLGIKLISDSVHHHSNKKKGGTNSIVPHCNCNEHPKMATLVEFLIMNYEKILHEIALLKYLERLPL